MFKIYDLNMKELPFPEGVKPLDIFVSSVNKRRLTEEFEGRSGALNYGYDYGERSVDLSLWLEAHDTLDYRLIRNELYAFFDTHDVFYIEETRIPSRVLKVTIDESYIPERINQTHSSVEISCRTLDSVFWESKYTTLELHDSGYSATAEKYGLVDNIDDEKVNYRFEPSSETVIPTAELFEQGNIHTGRGDNLATSDHARTKGFFQTLKGSRYTLNLSDTTGNSSYIRIYNYNSDGSYISDDSGMFSAGNEYTFTAIGDKIRLVVYPERGKLVKASDIGGATKIYFEGYFGNAHTLNVYNAGNVTVEPENMMLNIELNGATSSGNLSLKNITTGEEFKLNKTILNRNVKLEGVNVTENGINVFRDTNRRFISFVPGDNHFEVTGATFDELSFEFKYLYK